MLWRKRCQFDPRGIQECRVVACRGELRVRLFGGVAAVLAMVVVDHPARGDTPTGDHALRWERDLSRLGKRAQVVGGLDGAQGA
ncbi:Uncharacterised protein [Mycobacteroides abscessus subsp. abscessus]|nr:Uncharacterised protein [Mycobacteroides abscessus subsp. abscessus]